MCGYVHLSANAHGCVDIGSPGIVIIMMWVLGSNWNPQEEYTLSNGPPLSSSQIPFIERFSGWWTLKSLPLTTSWSNIIFLQYLMMKGFHLNQTCPRHSSRQVQKWSVCLTYLVPGRTWEVLSTLRSNHTQLAWMRSQSGKELEQPWWLASPCGCGTKWWTRGETGQLHWKSKESQLKMPLSHLASKHKEPHF